MQQIQVVQQQMERFLAAIRMVDDADCLWRVMMDFELVRPWWKLCGFTSSINHVAEHIRMKATEKHADETKYLRQCRKNDPTRGSTQENINNYTEIFRRMNNE